MNKKKLIENVRQLREPTAIYSYNLKHKTQKNNKFFEMRYYRTELLNKK